MHLLFTEQSLTVYLGVSSSTVDGGPQGSPGSLPSKYRFYSARHCDLHIAPWPLGGLCSDPCRWKCALTLTASLSSSWPSDQRPAGVSTATRDRA